MSADAGGSTAYAAYTYLGAGTIVRTEYPGVSGQLVLDCGAGGSYPGLDAFGRVVDQHWRNGAGSATLDRYAYGYDRNSNRTWRESLAKMVRKWWPSHITTLPQDGWRG